MNNLYNQHEKHYLAVDNIIFGYAEKNLKILLIKRNFLPERGNWSLMGGFVKGDESLDLAAARVVKELTGLDAVFMEQLYTYGKVDRDPEARTISVAYYTLIRVDLYDSDLGSQYGAKWFSVENLPPLIFDHREMVQQALQVLRQKTRTQPIGFNLLPEKFTIPQLKSLYEAIHQRILDPGNFSKKIKKMKLLTRLDEKDKSQSKKGAFYYQFDKDRYEELREKGFYFDLNGFLKRRNTTE